MQEEHIAQAEKAFQKATAHLKTEYGKLQIGRANPELVDGLLVEAYGSTQELRAIAGISVADAKTLQIQPWDAHILGNVEKAIRESKLGLNPLNDGRVIRLAFPDLTEERRRELAKKVHEMAEEAKVSVRNARQEAHSAFRELEQKKEMTEDDRRFAEKQLQEKVDEANQHIEELANGKEEEVMKI